ncbi:kelch repeat-containing protein [uncultured Acetobacteroides sp.]|uniref:Kelch repeat-containing protein n=1 Tax=uncultured Acetobacteroides sp. TaxID=1760811 RepID=UPI0029F4770B|nr:kelch repeat-containing protein [uncultured Acetobacteroides sp.]
MKLLVAVLISGIVLTSCSKGDEIFHPVFEKLKDTPLSERQGAVAATIDGYGFVGLGVNTNGDYLNDFWKYNENKKTWTRIADYPGEGYNASTAFTVGKKLYVGLGFSVNHENCSDLWMYDPSTNKWERKADFPGMARYSAKSFVVGGCAYVGTGTHNSSDDYLSDFWKYDPKLDKWMQVESMPGIRCGAVAFSCNGKGYVGLGISQGGYPYRQTKDFYEYDPIKDEWRQIQDFPTYRYAAVAFTLKGKAYVGFGCNNEEYFSDLWTLDAVAKKWVKVEIGAVPNRRDAIAFEFDKRVLIGTGRQASDIVLPDFWDLGLK